MKPEELTKVVLYWLEFERLCGREHLLSEMSLRLPIGEYLIATQNHQLLAEEPYPPDMQPIGRGRRKAMDYCLRRQGGARTWTHIFESKWVNGKRDIRQELFDDLVRLEGVRHPTQTVPFERILLVAGYLSKVRDLLIDASVGQVLPQAVGIKTNIDVMKSHSPTLDYWKDAAKAVPFTELPLTMSVKLESFDEVSSFGCWIWKINRVSKRSLRIVDQTS